MEINYKLIGVSLLLAAGLSACDKPGVKEAGSQKVEIAAKTASPSAETVAKDGEKPGEQGANTRDDSEITAKVQAALSADQGLTTQMIDVVTEKGVVLLSGFVASELIRNRAKELATAVSGVTRVDDRLVPRSDR